MKTKRKKDRTRSVGEAQAPLRLRKILVPVDFSPASVQALVYAADVAVKLDAKLVLIYVVAPPAIPEWGYAHLVVRDQQLALDAEAKLEELAKGSGVAVALVDAVIIKTGDPFIKIPEAAEEMGCELVVLSTHGRTGLGHAVLGSTAERVVRHAHCPVLTIRQKMFKDSAKTAGFAPKSILVPVDFSGQSKAALRYAVRFARQFGATLDLIYVVPSTLPADVSHATVVLEDERRAKEAELWLANLCETELPPEQRGLAIVRAGGPYHEITAAAELLNSDLIIMATRGHTGLNHILLGSTAERVLRHAPCPVLVVR